MPRNDGTGPLGNGAMTGRGLGRCSNVNAIRFNGRGKGMRASLGCRRGFGRRFYSNELNPKNEKALLEKQKDILELELKDINEILKNYTEDDEE